jgi:outer membrane protein
MLHSKRFAALSVLLLWGIASVASGATLPETLAHAYSSNPEINSARANARAVDENVPLAKSGLRPIVSAFASVTGERTSVTGGATGAGGAAGAFGDQSTNVDGEIGIQITQNVFQGFRVRNAIRESEAGVLAVRDLLRNTVQNVLFDAAQAYMDVWRDMAILDIRRKNVLFLQQQVRASQERLEVGENTRTDVAQTRARLATGRANLILAQANLETDEAIYRRIVGRDPTGVTDTFPYRRLIPASSEQAVIVAQNQHPIVSASIHQADAQAFLVKQAEGELLPTVTLEGTAVHNEGFDAEQDPNVLTLSGRVSIPIYQGGAVSARIRQAKEQYGLRKIEIDLARDQVRAAVVSAWAQAEAAAGAIGAANEAVDAANTALEGVLEEERVGQRTQLDVLDAQQELLNARETLIVARRDLVVARFALLSAMGRLSAEDLDLNVAVYDPAEHYDAVKNKAFGVRTPDGR